jgi:hypothetical protein
LQNLGEIIYKKDGKRDSFAKNKALDVSFEKIQLLKDIKAKDK